MFRRDCGYIIIMKSFKEWLMVEMPLISMRGKEAYADEDVLRDVDVDQVQNNIVVFRIPESSEGGFFEPGTTWVYFMDSEESANKMKSGEIPMLTVPQGTFLSGGSPITDVWKKKFAKKGTEHILGIIEGNTKDDLIYINMMTVRPKYKRNTINSKMIQFLKKGFPNAELKFSDPTDEGKKFIDSLK